MLLSVKKIKQKKSEVIHVRVSAEALAALRKRAVEEKVSLSWLVARAAEKVVGK